MQNLADIEKQIAELQKKAEAIRSQNKAMVIEEIKNKISEYGLTASDLGLQKKSKPAKATNVTVVKYRNDAGDTWSGGRGRKPAWVQAILDANGDIEKYRVA